MINSFSLQQIQKTSNLIPDLISRQYKLNLMADFMRVKYENPKMKQSQIANQIGSSTSTIQRYKNDKNMLSPYKINQITSLNEQKRLQVLFLTTIYIKTLTSKDLNQLQMKMFNLLKTKRKIL